VLVYQKHFDLGAREERVDRGFRAADPSLSRRCTWGAPCRRRVRDRTRPRVRVEQTYDGAGPAADEVQKHHLDQLRSSDTLLFWGVSV
jgi:hypothetical protein